MNTTTTTDTTSSTGTNTTTDRTAARRSTHRLFVVAGSVALAAGLSSCGLWSSTSSSDSVATPTVEAPAEQLATEAPAEQPAAEQSAAVEAPVEQAAAEQPAAEQPPASASDDDVFARAAQTGQVIPASSPDLPCGEYVAVEELPAFACSTGAPVEAFQSWVAYVNDGFVVDGFFGSATQDAVIDYQRSFGMVETGVIDQALMDMMEATLSHEEPIDDGAWEGDDEGEIHDEAMGVYCQELADGLHPDANVTADVIEICEMLDVRLTSGD